MPKLGYQCYTLVTTAIVVATANATKKEMERASHHPTVDDNVDSYLHCWTTVVAYLPTLVQPPTNYAQAPHP